VPEIENGIVQIKSVAREAGSRCNIAVWSSQDNIDPVGSCVGQRGTRVQTVITELGGEKIDIVEWSENFEKFIASALSPAKVISLKINEKEKSALVKVAEEQLSLAIGKSGQNVRLASRLTTWSIDIRSKKDIAKEKLESAMSELPPSEESGQESESATATPATGMASIEGVGPKTLAALAEAGYKDLEDLKKATLENLLAVKGIGQKTAEKIIAAVSK